MRHSAVLLVVTFLLGTVQSPAQPKGEVKPVVPPKVEAPTLEGLQAEALRNNLALRVAQAELALAEARYLQARGELLARVAIAKLKVDAARDVLAEATRRHLAAQKLPIGEGERADFALAWVRAKNDAAAAETRLAMLLGPFKKDAVPLEKNLDLEKLTAQALKGNAEIRVEEATLRLAEAKYERARSHLFGQIAAGHADLDAAIAAENEARVRFGRAEHLLKTGSISREEFDNAKATYQKLRSERLLAEARLNHLVGRLAPPLPKPSR